VSDMTFNWIKVDVIFCVQMWQLLIRRSVSYVCGWQRRDKCPPLALCFKRGRDNSCCRV